jgi:hypothetical protein
MNYEKMSTIIMSIGIMSLFLIIFFFTYGAYVEHEMVSNEIIRLANIESTYIHLLPDIILDMVKEKIDSQINEVDDDKNIKAHDEKVTKNNNEIIEKALTIFGITSAILVILSIIIYLKYRDFSILDVIKVNVLTTLIIAIIEVFFATYIIKLYKPLDINLSNTTILKNIYTSEKYSYLSNYLI